MIVSFDPGVSTGIAILKDDGEVISTHVGRNLNEVTGYAGAISAAYKDEELKVVAESGPQYQTNYRSHIEEIERVIKTVFPDATWIEPSRWKGTPQSRASLPQGLTQHERDAVRMALWFKDNSDGNS